MLDKVVKRIPKPIHNQIQILKEKLFQGYSIRSYSVDGMDLILQSELSKIDDVFYVDVGANHPFWSSNSYLLYKRGAQGINIDATPGIMDIFHSTRHRDINLEYAVSNKSTKMTYLVFDFAAYNGFEGTFETDRLPYIHLKQKIQIAPKSLSWILGKYLPKKTAITVLFVDTEGHDLNVLKSNDWRKYRPKYIVTEWFSTTMRGTLNSEINKYLTKQKYDLIASTRTNILFKRQD